MQIEIAAVTDYQERSLWAFGDPAFNALVVMNVRGPNHVRRAAGVMDRVLGGSGHVGAAAVLVVEGINRVMQRENQSLVLRRGGELVRQPLQLDRASRSSWRPFL